MTDKRTDSVTDSETNRRKSDAAEASVSSAYAQLRSDTVPQHLDQQVLKMATAATRPTSLGRLLTPGWIKPTAVAATLMLSFAIVLQVAELQPVPGSPAASPVETREVEESTNVDTATSNGVTSAKEDYSEADSVAKSFQPRDEAMLERARQTAAVQDGPDPVALPQPEPEVVAEEKRLDADLSPARSRSAPANAAFRFEQTAPATAGVALERECEAIDRSDPDDWMECIDALRKSGKLTAADSELAAFAEQFPSYEPADNRD